MAYLKERFDDTSLHLDDLCNLLTKEITELATAEYKLKLVFVLVRIIGESQKALSGIDIKDCLKELQISHFHVFGYSMRKGTVAADMEQIQPQIKKARVDEVLALAAKKNLSYRKNLIGTEAEVLTERVRNHSEGKVLEVVDNSIQALLYQSDSVLLKKS